MVLNLQNILKMEKLQCPGASFVVYKEVVEGAEQLNIYAQVTEGVLTGWTKNKTEATKLITANETGIITVDGLDLGDIILKR